MTVYKNNNTTVAAMVMALVEAGYNQCRITCTLGVPRTMGTGYYQTLSGDKFIHSKARLRPKPINPKRTNDRFIVYNLLRNRFRKAIIAHTGVFEMRNAILSEWTIRRRLQKEK